MLPKLPLIALGVLLISSPAALAATPSAPIPAEGQVSVTFAAGVKSVKVKSAPAGITVAGGVKGGKLAIAVVHPRGVAASGKVELTIKGKATRVKTIAAALDGGKAPNCKDLASLLSKRLKGSADIKGLAGVLAAKLCGKAAAGNAADVLRGLGLGAAPAAPAPAAALASPTPQTGGSLARPTPTATPTPPAKACANGSDDDGDGQVDLEDPGCADGNDGSEAGEVAVSQECLSNGSGVSMGDDPTALFGALNRCGPFVRVRVGIAPGIASCQILTGGTPWTCGPSGTYAVGTGTAIDTADLLLTANGAVKCDRKATIALYRPNGEVAEIYAPIASCTSGGGPQPGKPACADGIDNDGDGMIDDHFADGAKDPDPGCTSTTDASENSELLPAGSCQLGLDLFDDDASIAIAAVQGCGQIQGFWFHAAGTVVDCAYKLGQSAIQTCETVRESGGTMFTKTTEALSVAVSMSAVGDCRPMTLAVIGGDGTVVATRKTATGC